MQTTKVGIREFRENLADYLESKTPIAITRHGATIGIYVPTKPKPSQADLQALRTAGEKMQELIAGLEQTKTTSSRTSRKYAANVVLRGRGHENLLGRLLPRSPHR
jgi:antitoxin (DNA-binding transcriptional repressor) of toxin-antitoxin stability system